MCTRIRFSIFETIRSEIRFSRRVAQLLEACDDMGAGRLCPGLDLRRARTLNTRGETGGSVRVGRVQNRKPCTYNIVYTRRVCVREYVRGANAVHVVPRASNRRPCVCVKQVPHTRVVLTSCFDLVV